MQQDMEEQLRRVHEETWTKAPDEIQDGGAERYQREAETLLERQLTSTQELHREQLADEQKNLGHENSELYTGVKTSMQMLYALQSGGIAADNISENLLALRNGYEALITACDNYLRERPGFRWSPIGRRRQKLITRMRESAIQERTELPALVPGIRTRLANGEQLAWTDVIGSMHAEHMEPTADEIEMGGGGSSEVVKITRGGATRFFKQEEKLEPLDEAMRTFYQGMRKEMEGSPARVARLERFRACQGSFLEDIGVQLDLYMLQCKLHPENEPQLFRDMIDAVLANRIESSTRDKERYLEGLRRDLAAGRNGVTQEKIDRVERTPSVPLLRELRPLYQQSEEARQDFLRLVLATRRADTLRGTAADAELTQGRDVTQRSAATSLMADLLDQSSLVVRTVRAEVKLPGDTEARRGILMDAAQGREINKFTDDETLMLEPTPEFIRQLSMLQVFDYLCGQYDRNATNYLLQTRRTGDRIEITGLCGIDNDMSFGTLTHAAGKFLTPVLQSQSPEEKARGDQPKFCTSFVDKDFAESILALTPEILVQQFSDQLTTDELKALVKRVGEVHRELDKRQRVPGFFLPASAWGAAQVTDAAAVDQFDKRYAAIFMQELASKKQAVRDRRAAAGDVH